MPDTYYCEYCEKNHKTTSKVGREHAVPEVEVPVDAPESPVSDVKEEVEAEGLEVPADAKISVKSSRADVYTYGGQFVRTYSKDVHGPDFLELAKGFAKKKGFKVE